jgi:tetratricopeptide (TPR) repeat protein
VLDDLHAADAPSLLLLRFVASELDGINLMVLGAYRNTEVGGGHQVADTVAELTREPSTRRLMLGGLSEASVARYIALTTGIAPRPSLTAAVHRGTEGNPLFVGELTRLLDDERLLEREGLDQVPIPRGVSDTIGRRLRRLSVECGRMLGVASGLGREFDLAALGRLSGVSGDELLELLDEALAARIVDEVPGARHRLRFSHALIRDVLYEQLGAARRARLHREIADTLVALYSVDLAPHLGEIAHHYFEAMPDGDCDSAIDYAARAAEHAAGLLAYEEAARLFRMSLEALDRQGSRDAEARCELLLALGDVDARAGDIPTARDSFRRAAELARSLNRAELLAQAALGYGGRLVWVRADDDLIAPLLEEALNALGPEHDELRVGVLARLCGALRDQPTRLSRSELSLQAVDIARGLDDPAALAYALEGRYVVLYDSPSTRIDERLAVAGEMTALGLQAGNKERALHGHFGRFIALMESGAMPAAKAELRTMTELAETLRQPAQRWIVTASTAAVALFEGRLAESEELIAQALEFGQHSARGEAVLASRVQLLLLRRHQARTDEVQEAIERCVVEYPQRRLLLTSLLADLHRQRGHPGEARAVFERIAAHDFADLNVDSDWLASLATLSEVAAFLGDEARCARLYELLAPHAERNGLNLPEIVAGSISRSLALLAATRSHWAQAEHHFRDALEMNARMGARPWLAYTREDHARMHLRRDPGAPRRARDLAVQAREDYRDLAMDAHAKRCSALLAELAS